MRLRLKISLAMLLLALVPLGVTTWQVWEQNVGALKQGAMEYRLATADVIVRAVRSTVSAAVRELKTIGGALGQDDVAPEDRQAVAKAALLGSSYIHRVAVYFPNGERMAVMSADVDDLLAAPRQIDEGVRGVARTEGVAYLGHQSSPGGALHLPFVVPVYEGKDKSVYLYLWSAMSLDVLSTEVGQISRRRFAKQGNRVFLVDREFAILAHEDRERIGKSMAERGLFADLSGGGHLTRDVAHTAEYSAGGEELLGALVPLPELGWGVVVEQARADAYAAVQRSLRTAMVVGAGGAIVALLVGLLLAGRLAAPVLSVSRAARKVAGGDFEVKVPVKGRDEVADMAKAFNTMADDLRRFRERIIEETRIRADLSRYLSADLVETIASNKAKLELGGERRVVTVVFADVVGFTPLSQQHPPELIVRVLNELFTFLTEIVFKHEGIVDKFMGDCVMAVFGIPYGHDDDAARAVRAAEEMMSWLDVGNAKWRKELGHEIRLGIGVNTGEVIAGNIGSEKRMEYTVIGDVVNVASRLETIAQPGQVLMTRATMQRVAHEFDCALVGVQQLTGRSEPTEIYALVE